MFTWNGIVSLCCCWLFFSEYFAHMADLLMVKRSSQMTSYNNLRCCMVFWIHYFMLRIMWKCNFIYPHFARFETKTASTCSKTLKNWVNALQFYQVFNLRNIQMKMVSNFPLPCACDWMKNKEYHLVMVEKQFEYKFDELHDLIALL